MSEVDPTFLSEGCMIPHNIVGRPPAVVPPTCNTFVTAPSQANQPIFQRCNPCTMCGRCGYTCPPMPPQTILPPMPPMPQMPPFVVSVNNQCGPHVILTANDINLADVNITVEHAICLIRHDLEHVKDNQTTLISEIEQVKAEQVILSAAVGGVAATVSDVDDRLVVVEEKLATIDDDIVSIVTEIVPGVVSEYLYDAEIIAAHV